MLVITCFGFYRLPLWQNVPHPPLFWLYPCTRIAQGLRWAASTYIGPLNFGRGAFSHPAWFTICFCKYTAHKNNTLHTRIIESWTFCIHFQWNRFAWLPVGLLGRTHETPCRCWPANLHRRSSHWSALVARIGAPAHWFQHCRLVFWPSKRQLTLLTLGRSECGCGGYASDTKQLCHMTDAPNHVTPGTLPFLYCSEDVEKTETAQDTMSLMMGWDGHAVRSCSPMDFQLGHRASAPAPAGEKLKQEKHCSNQKLQITDQSVLTQCTQLHPNLPDSCFWSLTPKYSGCLDILYHQLSNPQQISQQCSVLWMVCCMSIPFTEGCMAGHPGVCSASDSFSLNRATWQKYALNFSTLGGGQLLWCHSVALPPFVPPPVRPKDRPPMEGNPRKLLDGQKRKALPQTAIQSRSFLLRICSFLSPSSPSSPCPSPPKWTVNLRPPGWTKVRTIHWEQLLSLGLSRWLFGDCVCLTSKFEGMP